MHRILDTSNHKNKSTPLLTDVEVARQLAVSVSSLRRWRMLGSGPRFVRVGGFLVRYLESDIAAWLNSAAAGGEPQPAEQPQPVLEGSALATKRDQ